MAMAQNELLLLLELLVDFSLVVLAYRFLGRLGLYSWCCIATVIANIQVAETVEIFGMTATLGNAAYASIFLATDILSEVYGRKSASRSVVLGFFSMLCTLCLMTLALFFKPAPVDFAHDSLKVLFGFLPRVVVGSLAAYLLSLGVNVVSYAWIRRFFPQRGMLWMRNALSTIVSQAIDTIIFTCIVFWGLYSARVFVSIALSTFVLKYVGALAAMPFIYWAVRKRTRRS